MRIFRAEHTTRMSIAAERSATMRYVLRVSLTLTMSSHPSIQFAGLWKYIKDWQNVYKHFDRDRSGTIDVRELRDALTQFGYNLSPRLLDQLERKYGASPFP